jgi:hypothetical protein
MPSLVRCMRRCRRWKLGRPCSSSATTSPSRIASCVPKAAERAQLRVARRDVVAVAALQAQPAAFGVADRPHAVPLDLVGPVLTHRQVPARAGEHRLDLLRQRLPVRVLRRVHPVDHPVLAARPEQDVLAAHALAVEDDHDLRVAPLLDLEGAAVIDPHRPRAVVARRDLAVEVEVLERVILGAHRQVVALGIGRDPLGDGPAGERALVLQAQVPVHRAGGVLLHDEAQRGVGLGRLSRRFRGSLEVAFGPIGVQAVGHPITNTR